MQTKTVLIPNGINSFIKHYPADPQKGNENPQRTYRIIKMAPQPLHLPNSLFTITEDNVSMFYQQQPQQEYEDYSVPLSSSTSAATLKLSKSSSSSSSSTSTSTSTSRSNRTGSASLKRRNLRLLSNVLDVLDSNPTSTRAATVALEEKFDATFARWEANATSSSIFASHYHQSDGDPPPTRPLRRFSPAA